MRFARTPFAVLLLLYLLVAQVYAQKKTEYVFWGTLTSGEQQVKYKLAIDNRSGTISGYGISDPGGAKETYFMVSGYVNQRFNTLSFQENSYWNASAKTIPPNPCFLHAELRLTTSPQGVVLEGSFTELPKKSSKSCSEGTIHLENAEDLRELFHAVELPMPHPEPSPTLTQTPIKPATEITAAVEKKYDVVGGTRIKLKAVSDSIRFLIWDDLVSDGDQISIMQGNKVLLDRYKIVRQMKEIRAELSAKGNSEFVFTANSAGTRPPNTAKILVTDGVKKYLMITKVPQNSSFSIQISR